MSQFTIISKRINLSLLFSITHSSKKETQRKRKTLLPSLKEDQVIRTRKEIQAEIWT